MSTLPLLLSIADELDNLRSNSYMNDFGLGLYPHQYYRNQPSSIQISSLPLRSLMHRQNEKRHGDNAGQVSQVGKDGFQVCMDVQQFKPSELTVKTVDNYIVVEGKHEEREDEHGYITRHFVRRYALPKGFDPNETVSTLSSDGVLTVKVPPPVKNDDTKERVIQIQQTGPAHLSVKDNPKENGNEKDAEQKK